MEGDQRTAKSSFWHHPLVVHPSTLKGFQVLQNDCKTCDPSGLQGTIQHQHDYYWFLRQGEIWMTRLITWEWLSEGWKLWQREWEWKGNQEWSLQAYCTFYDKLIQLKAWNSYLQANISSSRHAVDTITACPYAIPVLYCLCTVNWSEQITSYCRDRLVNWRQERERQERELAEAIRKEKDRDDGERKGEESGGKESNGAEEQGRRERLVQLDLTHSLLCSKSTFSPPLFTENV